MKCANEKCADSARFRVDMTYYAPGNYCAAHTALMVVWWVTWPEGRELHVVGING